MYESALTGREACEALRISRQTLNRLRKSGQLPSFTINRARRYRAEDVEAFIESRIRADRVASYFDLKNSGRPESSSPQS